MTKIESAAPAEDREALKKEILAEIKSDARRKKLLGCAGCLLFEFLLVAVPLVFAAVIIAKTGLVSVPLFTNWLYRPAEPVRTVVPISGMDSEQIMRAALLRADIDPALGKVEVKLLESEMTRLVRDGLAAAEDSLPLPLRSAQLAVSPDGIEFFALTPKDDRNVTIKGEIIPTVKDGRVEFGIRGVSVGALTVPDGISRSLAPIFDRVINDALAGSSDLGELKDVRLEEGAMTLVVSRQF